MNDLFKAIDVYLSRKNVTEIMTGIVLSYNSKTTTVRLIGSTTVQTCSTIRGISPEPGDIAILMRINSTTWVVIGSYEG